MLKLLAPPSSNSKTIPNLSTRQPSWKPPKPSETDYQKSDETPFASAQVVKLSGYDINCDINDLIVVEKQSTVPNSRKIFSHPVVSYDDSNEETTFKEQEFVPPDTLFSPKDKVSNLTWNNKLPLSCDVGITTSRKNGGRCGCVVQNGVQISVRLFLCNLSLLP